MPRPAARAAVLLTALRVAAGVASACGPPGDAACEEGGPGLHLLQRAAVLVQGPSLLAAQGARPRLVLHHIWKTAGTHLCALAQAAGAAAPLNNGCHRFRDDRTPASTEAFSDQSLWRPCAILPGLAELPFDVVGHECAINATLMDEAQSSGFGVVEVLRDPLEQAASWFQHCRKTPLGAHIGSSIREWYEVCNERTPCIGFCTLSPNLQTSWIAGGRCADHPEEDGCVEKALRNLRRMLAVLEQSGNQLRGLEKLDRFGWRWREYDQNPYVSHGAAYLSNASAEERAWLLQLQKVDVELLNAARAEGLI